MSYSSSDFDPTIIFAFISILPWVLLGLLIIKIMQALDEKLIFLTGGDA